MARYFGNLKVKQIENMKPGDKPLNDGGGLQVSINKTGSKKWLFRYTFNQKSKSISCGGDGVTLKQARETRDKYAAMLPARDPKTAEKAKVEIIRSDVPKLTVGDLGQDVFENIVKGDLKPGTKGYNGEWISQVEKYCVDIWNTPLCDLTIDFIVEELKPFAVAHPGTYKKVRGRLERIYGVAQGRGIVDSLGRNLFETKLLKNYFRNPRRGVDFETTNYPHMHFSDVPKFFDELSKSKCSSANALRYLIFSVARSTAARGLELPELDGNTWHVPGARMKGMSIHDTWTTYVSDPALEQVDACGTPAGKFVFKMSGEKSFISSTAMKTTLESHLAGIAAVEGGAPVPHGFRSSFKNWAAENDYDDLLSEVCLAHKDSDEVRRAYLRTSFMDKRKRLMDDWSRFVLGYKT